MLMTSADISQLIMVCYHRPNALKRCLHTIVTNTGEPIKLAIIDNSGGKLDSLLTLDWLETSSALITVYRNEYNLGKGGAVQRWYNTIMADSKADHFISIDPDLEVTPQWLLKLKIAMLEVKRRHPLGLLAPVLVNNFTDTFQAQLDRNQLVMHRNHSSSRYFNHHIYYNRYTAGPLLLIDRGFFESVGGYHQDQLYGNDDGRLCAAAAKTKRFLGIVTDVPVLHSDLDSDDGYRAWKRRNVSGNVDKAGYWD